MFSCIELSFEWFDSHAVVYHDMVGLVEIDDWTFCGHLWVMEKEGLSTSWSKLYTIDLGTDTAPCLLHSKEKECSSWLPRKEKWTCELYDIGFQEVKQIKHSSPNVVL